MRGYTDPVEHEIANEMSSLIRVSEVYPRLITASHFLSPPRNNPSQYPSCPVDSASVADLAPSIKKFDNGRMPQPIAFSGHVIGLLKEYMGDLVDQATQEQRSQQQFGFTALPYRPDQAFSDLLALLDDRIESEGVQVGLPNTFLHDMWTLCNEALPLVADRVWLEVNLDGSSIGKARLRELTYHFLIQFIESRSRERS